MRQQGIGEDYIMRDFVICIPHQILCEWSNKRGQVALMREEKCVQGFGDERRKRERKTT